LLADRRMFDEPSDVPGLAIRHNLERRLSDRRSCDRGTRDRRRRARRRFTLRSVLFAAFAFAVPQQLKSSTLAFLAPPSISPSAPRVTTRIESFEAVPPQRAYDDLIAEAAQAFGVDPNLIRSVMEGESAFDPSAVSRKGAMGLMQLMPDIAEAYGVEHPFDPRENIMAGAQILRELVDFHRGDLQLVLASYNAGAAVVASYGTVPPFVETQEYVKRVSDLLEDAKRAENE
jgi:soluble lytic murein transglycosylase-like protein